MSFYIINTSFEYTLIIKYHILSKYAHGNFELTNLLTGGKNIMMDQSEYQNLSSIFRAAIISDLSSSSTFR